MHFYFAQDQIARAQSCCKSLLVPASPGLVENDFRYRNFHQADRCHRVS